jgi:hypothetical protein
VSPLSSPPAILPQTKEQGQDGEAGLVDKRYEVRHRQVGHRQERKEAEQHGESKIKAFGYPLKECDPTAVTRGFHGSSLAISIQHDAAAYYHLDFARCRQVFTAKPTQLGL